MSCFVVSNLLDTIVCRVGKTEISEGLFVEYFYALLIEAEDDPLGTEEILEKNVVYAIWPERGIHNWSSVQGRERSFLPTVRAVVVRLAWNGSKGRIIELGSCWGNTC